MMTAVRRSVFAVLVAVTLVSVGLMVPSAGASSPKAVTMTVTITTSQFAQVKTWIASSHIVPSNSDATADLFIFMCPLEGIVPPYPKIISNGSSDDVTFRVHLSATQVARANKAIRAGDCGSIHTVQQDYKSAFAQWAAGNIAPASTSTSPPTTTTVPQESPGQYEAACTAAPPYGALASPTAQTGVCVTYQAQVFQYDANTGTTEMLVYVTNDGDSIWQDLVKLSLPQSVVSQDFIENDVIQFWGATAAPYSYTTEQNGTNTIPAVNVKYATLVSAASS